MAQICKTCGRKLPDGCRKDTQYCSLKCANQYRNQIYRIKHPEKVKDRRLVDNSFTERRMLTRIKSRCKLNNIPFNLDLDDIKIPEFCPVLGIKLNPRTLKATCSNESPSLDRIYPDKGYIKGNVRVISARANLLKSNATVEELECVLNDLKILYGKN